MILYFSGTGNSRWVAETLAGLTGDEARHLLDFDPESIAWYGSTLGIVCPVYSWGIPPLVAGFLKNLNAQFRAEASMHPVWAVLVCGDEVALAPEMLMKALKSPNFQTEERKPLTLFPSYIWSVQMPNNYVLLPGFGVDSPALTREKLEKASVRVAEIAGIIPTLIPAHSAKETHIDVVRGSLAWAKTRLVYPLFTRWGVNPAKLHATDACISCGQCARICPVHNVTMTNNGKPVWGKRCVSCTACYHICPVHAVRYGRMTDSYGQYFHPSRRN